MWAVAVAGHLLLQKEHESSMISNIANYHVESVENEDDLSAVCDRKIILQVASTPDELKYAVRFSYPSNFGGRKNNNYNMLNVFSCEFLRGNWYCRYRNPEYSTFWWQGTWGPVS